MSRPRIVAVLLTAAVLGGLAYSNSLPNGFHFDDGHSIEDNAWLRSLAFIPRYFWDVATFSPLAENRSYRPFLLIGFAGSHWLGQGQPWAFRLVSIGLHVLSAAVIGLLTVRLWRAAHGEHDPTGRAGFMAALVATAVMATHPLATEAVNYISARSSLQAATWMFVSIWLYVRARETASRWSLAGSTAALLLAMGTKIIAVTAPALALFWALLLGPERWLGSGSERGNPDGGPPRLRRLALSLLPLAAVAFGFTVLHETIVGGQARAARSAIAPWNFFLTETRVWAHYQALFVWPQDLCADLVMRWSQSPWEGPVARSLLWAGLLTAVALAARRRFPIFSFGVIWYFVALSPTNSFVPLSEPASEHRVYIALPGLIWAVIGLAGPLAERWTARHPLRHRALTATVVACVIGLAAATWSRNRVWRDGESLWGDVLTCSANNGRAHLNYGRAKMMKGDFAAAAKSFEQCRALLPNWIFCRINHAALTLAQGRVQEAESHMAAARRLQPDNVYTQIWSGKVYRAQGRHRSAELAFRTALRIAPGFDEAERGVAMAVFDGGRYDEAGPLLARLAEQGRLDADGWFAWGVIAERNGEAALARQRFEAAQRLDPRHRKARQRLQP